MHRLPCGQSLLPPSIHTTRDRTRTRTITTPSHNPAQPHPYLHTSIPSVQTLPATTPPTPPVTPTKILLPLLNIFHFHPVVKARVGTEPHFCDRLTQLEKGFKSL